MKDEAILLDMGWGEWYPVFDAQPAKGTPVDYVVEVSAGTWKRWREAQGVFAVAQQEMREALERAGIGTPP